MNVPSKKPLSSNKVSVNICYAIGAFFWAEHGNLPSMDVPLIISRRQRRGEAAESFLDAKRLLAQNMFARRTLTAQATFLATLLLVRCRELTVPESVNNSVGIHVLCFNCAFEIWLFRSESLIVVLQKVGVLLADWCLHSDRAIVNTSHAHEYQTSTLESKLPTYCSAYINQRNILITRSLQMNKIICLATVYILVAADAAGQVPIPDHLLAKLRSMETIDEIHDLGIPIVRTPVIEAQVNGDRRGRLKYRMMASMRGRLKYRYDGFNISASSNNGRLRTGSITLSRVGSENNLISASGNFHLTNFVVNQQGIAKQFELWDGGTLTIRRAWVQIFPPNNQTSAASLLYCRLLVFSWS